MSIKELGEFGLIEQLAKNTIVENKSVIIGIGDDAAAVVPRAGMTQLLTTDMLVEDIHFKLEWITLFQLGYKAMAVNISDIAAMGGYPKQALVSIAIPAQYGAEDIIELYSGMKQCCREYTVNIVGGDTVASITGLVINVTVLGEVFPDYMVRRSGAQIGDVVAVTGTLGDSAAGLDILRKEISGIGANNLVQAHFLPKPQVAVGQILASCGATSMNDISDGLASEINEIAKASGVGIELIASNIPLSKDLLNYAGAKALDFALYGGEDYQLVFTISPQNYNKIAQQQKTDIMITKIGQVCNNHEVVLIDDQGNRQELRPQGYNHFR